MLIFCKCLNVSMDVGKPKVALLNLNHVEKAHIFFSEVSYQLPGHMTTFSFINWDT